MESTIYRFSENNLKFKKSLFFYFYSKKCATLVKSQEADENVKRL
jgi:hypothetical protein